MKTKRLISLLLAAVFALSAAATPALAASAGSALPDLTTAGVDENNSVVSIRLTADGDLTYGSPFTLSVQTTPADTQYIGAGLCDPDPFGQDPHPAQDDPPAEKDVGEP